MKVGAEPKKVAILGVLMSAAGVLLYTNVFSGPDAPAPTTRPTVPQAAAPAATATRPASKNPPPPNIQRARAGIRGAIEEFRPSFKGLDATGVDPTLRLDLLARVQNVTIEGGGRSLFQFASAPPPPAAKPVETTKIAVKPIGPEPPPPPVVPTQPPKPQAPPITLKYYGWATPRQDGKRRAFFLDGEDIIVATEGETIKRRYKVVRISNTSVVMEDTDFKSQQTLTIQQEQT